MVTLGFLLTEWTPSCNLVREFLQLKQAAAILVLRWKNTIECILFKDEQLEWLNSVPVWNRELIAF